jgi:competence protein ComEA
VALAVLGLAGLAGVWFGAPAADPPPVAIAYDGSVNRAPSTEEVSITVHVAGAVRSPGLVTLQAGDRVAHAIAAARGALAVAELSALNLAAILDDGDQVIVPVKGATTDVRSVTTNDDGLVDLNHAAAIDLEALPGVGPVLAQRIFHYRQENGRFETVEDLLDVPGIGEAKLADIRAAVILR